MKTVIGIVGHKGSGKETFADILSNCISPASIAHIRSSDILGETLKLWDLPHTRSNLQNLAIVMDKTFGIGSLTDAVLARINNESADVVIFDGVRWPSDVSMIRSFPKNFLIHITASEETRYKRTKLRKEKSEEDFRTLEEFKREEQVVTELDIPKIGEKADMTINNDGSLEDLKKHVSQFCASYLK